jgi:SAM-dependent methyltransferase
MSTLEMPTLPGVFRGIAYLQARCVDVATRQVSRWINAKNSPEEMVQITRRRMSERFVVGTGIEVGAGSRPFPLPETALCRYGDVRDRESLRNYFSTDRVAVDHMLDAQTYTGIPDNAFDFVISAHVIEHLEDPIGAIKNSLRVLKPGGILLLVVPDRRHTFDRLRPGTSLEHLLQDFHDGGISTRLEAYKEHARYVHPAITGEFLSDDRIETDAPMIMAAKMDAHFHCWNRDEFREVLSYCCKHFGAVIEAIDGPRVNENLFVARKLKPQKLIAWLKSHQSRRPPTMSIQ